MKTFKRNAIFQALSKGLSYQANSVSPVSGRGYVAGGNRNDGYSNRIDSFDFLTEGLSANTASLSTARMYPRGAYSSSKGYIAGSNEPATSRISSLMFSTGAVADPISAVLSVARSDMAGTQSSAKAYFAGGYTSTSVVQTRIDALTFSTEALAMSSAVLAAARFRMANMQSTVKGYFCGGFDSGYAGTNTLYGITFATDTGFTSSNTLSSSRHGANGLSSTSKGYISGSTLYDAFDFATESRSVVSASIAPPSPLAACLQSSLKGYALGGISASRMKIDSLEFATELATTIATVLSPSGYGMAGMSYLG